MKILYVDDSRYTRMVLQKTFQQAGHEAQGAASGAEALEILCRGRPDLLVTDLLMEGIGGKDLLQKSRALYPDLPVVVVTADVQTSTHNECMELGAAAVCSKSLLYPDGQAFMKALADVVARKVS